MSDLLNLSLDAIMQQKKAENKKKKPKQKPKQQPKAQQQKKSKQQQKIVQPSAAGKSRSRVQARKAKRNEPYKKRGPQQNGKWVHDKAPGKAESYTSKSKRTGAVDNQPKANSGASIMISNLNKDIMIGDILELYQDVGDIKSAELHYTASGAPKGSAEVVYVSKKHALAAIQKYHQRELDGRPMRVQLLSGGRQEPAERGGGRRGNAPRREAPKKRRSTSRGRDSRRGGRRDSRNGPNSRESGRNNPRQAERRGRGNGRGDKGGDRKKKPISEEDLDAEMDKYMEEAKK